MRNLLILAFLLTLTACGGSEDSAPVADKETPEYLYDDALGLMDKKSYKNAVKAFEEVERQHPDSDWAARAQIMAAYAAYKADDYEQAITIAERFTQLHPGSESAPYAYYLVALSHYEQINDVGRDQKITQQALDALVELMKRFPSSDYARDAKLKLDLVYDHLAGKEMQVGRYYLVRDEYLAAINRFQAVVEQYQTTSHVPEALHRLVEAYLKLGLKDEAQKYAAVLGHNFPGNPWYKDSYRFFGNALPPSEPPKEDGGFMDHFLP
jgi:outer membrane protein assembly factor BamD